MFDVVLANLPRNHEGVCGSPDGSQILFLRAEPDIDPVTGSLYLVNVDGTGLHRITPPGLDVGQQARWSPDGKEIVFSGPVPSHGTRSGSCSRMGRAAEGSEGGNRSRTGLVAR